MKHAFLGLALVGSLALLFPGLSLSQSAADEAVVTASSAPVAYVYVTTSNGINAYDASTAGKLTLITGSPFKQTTGLAIGSTGKYFITLGLFWLHAYAIEPNGAIGKQVSAVDTRTYGGGDCETYPDENLTFGTDGAILDHAGQNVYVFISASHDEGQGCAAYQTYNIAKNGELTFNSDDEWYTPASQQSAFGMLFTGNDKFGFAYIWDWGESETPYYTVNEYKRGTQGALEPGGGSYGKDPEPPPGYEYDPGCVNCSDSVSSMAADSTNHLAFVMTAYSIASYGYDAGATQLASYTVDSKGDLVSTNTWKDMPTVPSGGLMSISPAGNLLAFAIGTGVQFYHFNGAKPITEYTGIIGVSGYVSSMNWDKSNHLYAVNGASGRLHIYDVTPTKEAEVAGSPYTIPGGAQSVFVVSK